MTPPKSSTERAQDRKRRMAEQGLKEVRNFWAHPDDVPAIKAFAEKLSARRERAAKRDGR